MIFLARFQVVAYVRSLRALYPLIVVALLGVVLLEQGPAGPARLRLATSGFTDTAAFLFPIGAWTTRALLDTEPDVQRHLSVLAVGGRTRAALASLLAGFTATLAVSAALVCLPVLQGLGVGLPVGAIGAGLLLHLFVVAAATVFGALTSRVIMPSVTWSLLTLLGGSAFLLVLSMGPLAWLSVPMIGWLRAGQRGPEGLTTALPGTLLHLALWTAAVGTGYVIVRRVRH